MSCFAVKIGIFENASNKRKDSEMTVYVDELAVYGSWKYGKSCHMTCDGPFEELHALAEKIGLKREFFQHDHPRPTLWHYDLTSGKRALAVQHGAIEITSRQYSAMIHEAIEKQQSGILRHACGHEEEHADLLAMDEESARLTAVRQRMSEQCSACVSVSV